MYFVHLWYQSHSLFCNNGSFKFIRYQLFMKAFFKINGVVLDEQLFMFVLFSHKNILDSRWLFLQLWTFFLSVDI